MHLFEELERVLWSFMKEVNYKLNGVNSNNVLSYGIANQHGAGLNPQLHSMIILQYTCSDDALNYVAKPMRDGISTTTIGTDENDPYLLRV